jgi:uncharacterized protein YbjT (DUF2867 family)
MARTLTIAVAGASGFVGSHLLEVLSREAKVVALSRRGRAASSNANITWRACDLFSAESTRAALDGADVAVYLVHSMMPTSRLFQGDFRDTDVLLADNFAKAAAQAGVQRIVYLGGLVPSEGYVSEHLASRLEVERALEASGLPVTKLRAGMIVGPGGSSFEMLCTLVERLPGMLLPTWTQSAAQAIFIDDVLTVLRHAIVDGAWSGETVNVVNGEKLTYEMLLRQTASALGRTRPMANVPITSTSFSKRWIELFSGAPYELISPLIDSLQCDMPSPEPTPEVAALLRYPTYASMLAESLSRKARPPVEPSNTRETRRDESTVRSVQRLASVPGHDAPFISREYMRWLPRFFRTVIRVTEAPGSSRVTFSFAFLDAPLLILERVEDQRDPCRDEFRVVGGLLAKPDTHGWLEFRLVAGGEFTLAAIHDFVPSLPWPVYRLTQAPIHAWVMRSFGRHLSRLEATEHP